MEPRSIASYDEGDDCVSVSSNASSVHDSITSETTRKKDRIRKIRERLGKNINIKNSNISQQGSNKMDHFPNHSESPTEKETNTTSIMTVKTLDESLHSDQRIPDMRKLRRKVTIKFKSKNGSNNNSNGAEDTYDEDDSSSLTYQASVDSSLQDSLTLGFKNVMIREYEVVPGNNPSVSSGAPVELGWAHAIEKHIEIDMYEDARHGRRRFKGQMRMPKEVRRNVLLHHGHTQKSIRRAAKDAKKR